MSKEKLIKKSDLIPDNRNFNKGSEKGQELIKKSILKFGAGRSILIDKNNRIIAGNKTTENFEGEDVLVIETTGEKLIAVKRTDIDLDSPEGREMALADNATAKENIVFDAELIMAEVGEAVCEEWGVQQIAKEEAEAKEDDYVVPVGGSNTDIVLGDLFEIGPHKLLCGSSTETDTWARLMNDELADLVVTDPPYNVNYTGKTKEKLKIENDQKTDGDFYQFLYDFYTALGSFTKAGGAWYVWHADSEGANFRKAMADAGIMVKQCLIWVKNSMVMGRQDYHWKHEPCLYGWKEGGAHTWYSDRKQTTVLNFDRPTKNTEHPTMKPIPLIAYQIGNSSKSGDIVCDGFGGSGTTMAASHQINRRCRMMELDPRYCQVIVDRMLKLDPNLVIKKNGKLYNAEAKQADNN
jgi:DNA modification methylase